MKIVITVISIVLMVRGCCCVAINNTNTVVVRASSSSSSSNSTSEGNKNPLRNVINCFKEDSLFKCFNDRVGLLIRVWRQALLNSVRRNGDQPLQVNQGLEQLIRDFGKAVYYGFTSIFYGNFSDDDEARSADDANPADPTDTNLERGHHHKKKKVHKEIKKLVIKIIVAIFLVMQKIKWALLMIQTILLNNFIIVATLFVLSKTIKVWHEIKHKHHIEKQVVVYDNVHHGHYDNGEHSDYEDGHSHNHGWGWWGRSLQTASEATPSELLQQQQQQQQQPEYENEYYNNRVIRSTNRKRRGTRQAFS